MNEIIMMIISNFSDNCENVTDYRTEDIVCCTKVNLTCIVHDLVKNILYVKFSIIGGRSMIYKLTLLPVTTV